MPSIGIEFGTSTKRRKTRGYTRDLKLLTLRPSEKIPLQFNEFGQAITDKDSPFFNHAGCVVRSLDNAPITCKKWEEVPTTNKERMYALIVEKFEFEQTEARKQWIFQVMGKQFTDHKSKLKRKYCNTKYTIEEKIQNCVETIPGVQWKEFVQYVTTPENETTSLGQAPSWWQMFCLTHKRKDGSMVDIASESILVIFRMIRDRLEKDCFELNIVHSRVLYSPHQ